MTLIKYYRDPSTEIDHLKIRLEKELVKQDIDGQILEIRDPNILLEEEVASAPAVKIDDHLILERTSFPSEGGFVNAVISQVQRIKNIRRASKIIVPVDFSESSENALKYALDFAKQIGVSIKLVHIFMPLSTPSVDGMVYTDDRIEKRQRKQLKEIVDEWIDKYKANIELLAGVFEYEFRLGETHREIEKMALDLETKMIVMGSTGSGKILKSMLGSVSIHVALHAKCPVLIIPAKTSFTPFDQILFANNSPAIDRNEIDRVRTLCGVEEAQVHAVHIYEKQTNYVQSGKELIHDNKEEKINEVVVFQKDLAEGLNTYAIEEDLDLIVIERKNHSFLNNLIHRSVTKNMAIYSVLPLLVLHENDVRPDANFPTSRAEIKL